MTSPKALTILPNLQKLAGNTYTLNGDTRRPDPEQTARVYVTGLGVISPVGLDAQSSWKNLVAGISGIDYISAFDPEPFETHVAAEVKGFDPTLYMDKKRARHLDRFAQFSVAATQEALSHAQLDMESVDPTRVAVIVGSGIGGPLHPLGSTTDGNKSLIYLTSSGDSQTPQLSKFGDGSFVHLQDEHVNL